jgi:hypothetical protein
MKSELEVEVPAGATATPTHFSVRRHDTALHQREDKRWECLSVKPRGGLLGYCLPEQMVKLMANGHRVEGLSWAEARADQFLASAISDCEWINEADWERERRLRQAHAGQFHFHGHGTEQEAMNCYQQFLQDFAEREPV